MGNRKRYNAQDGVLTSQLASGATSMIDTAKLPGLPVVTAPSFVVVTMNPDEKQAGAPEILYITAHTSSATSATVLRAQEGTSQQTWPVGTKWEHGPTAYDFEQADNHLVLNTQPGVAADVTTGSQALLLSATGLVQVPPWAVTATIRTSITGAVSVTAASTSILTTTIQKNGGGNTSLGADRNIVTSAAGMNVPLSWVDELGTTGLQGQLVDIRLLASRSSGTGILRIPTTGWVDYEITFWD